MYHLLLRLLVLFLAMSLLSACGSAKTASGGTDLASRDIPVDQDGDGVLDGLLSECNEITDNDFGLEGPVSTFWDPFQKKFISDLIRLKFNSAPAELTSSSTHYMHIFRWAEEKNGQRKTNTTPVEIYFQLKGTGEWVGDKSVDTLSKSVIQNLITENDLEEKGVSLANFFDRVVMVLDGMDLSYDAMTLALYDSTVGGEAVNFVEVLLPAFHSNPNDYAKGHDSVTLRNLHPMWQHRNSNYTDDQFWYETRELCEGF